MRARIIGEAFGTFFLCFALLLGGGPLPLAALLAALTYLAAPAGFPHFNPAVTLAFRLRGRIASRAAWAFVGAQLLAAAAALLLAACLQGHDPERAKEAVAGLHDDAFEGLATSFVTEGLGAAFLVLVALVVGASRRTAGNSYFGLAMGLAALGYAGALADYGPFLNPLTALVSAARGWVEAVLDGSADAKAVLAETLLLAKLAPRLAADIAAQFAGAASAAWFFRMVSPEDR